MKKIDVLIILLAVIVMAFSPLLAPNANAKPYPDIMRYDWAQLQPGATQTYYYDSALQFPASLQVWYSPGGAMQKAVQKNAVAARFWTDKTDCDISVDVLQTEVHITNNGQNACWFTMTIVR